MKTTKDGHEIIDTTKRVEVVATKEAPYHKEGQKVLCSELVAAKMVKKGWAKDSAKKEK
jgi:hypothetical protein